MNRHMMRPPALDDTQERIRIGIRKFISRDQRLQEVRVAVGGKTIVLKFYEERQGWTEYVGNDELTSLVGPNNVVIEVFKGNRVFCRRQLEFAEIGRVATIGKWYDLTLENVEQTAEEAPRLDFFIKFTNKQRLSFDVFEKQRILQVDTFNGTIIPNRYGTKWRIKPRNILKYRKFMPQCDLRQIIRQFEKEQSQSDRMKMSKHTNNLQQAQNGFRNRLEEYNRHLNLQVPPETEVYSYDLLTFQEDFAELDFDSDVHDVVIGYLAARYHTHQQATLYCQEIIKIANRVVALVKTTTTERTQMLSISTKLLIFIVKNLSPYFRNSTDFLIEDMVRLKILARQHLKNFNDKLINIGIQNIMTGKMLELFSDEHPELTYRIWDMLLYCYRTGLDMSVIMLTISYTYLSYLEANNMTEYVPINNFMVSVVENSNRVKECLHTAQHVCRELRIDKRKNMDFANQKYLRRFLNFDEATLDIPEEDSVRDRNTHPLVNIRNNVIKLVENPRIYSVFRRPVAKSLHVMLKKLSVGHSMELEPYSVQLSVGNTSKIVEYDCTYKTIYINHYEKYSKVDRVEIRVFNNKVVLEGSIDTDVLERDTVHKINVLLHDNQLTMLNVFKTVIEVLLVVEENRSSKINEPTIKYELPRKIADLDKDNDLVKMAAFLRQFLEKMKNPLDEFSQPYRSLKIPPIYESEYDWIKNSVVSIEHIKRLFRHVFITPNDREYELQWTNLYKEYYYKELDQFQLGRFLISLILQVKTNRHTKLRYLYEVVRKYQGGTALTNKTIRSVLEELFLRMGYVNLVTLRESEVLKATITMNVGAQEVDITELMNTWLFINQSHFKTGDIMLGDSGSEKGLILLKALFDKSLQQRIFNCQGCNLSMTYRLNQDIYQLELKINERFRIVERGQKMYGKYAPYNKLNNVCSEAELLHNCENIVMMEDKKGKQFRQFSRIVRKNPMLNYLLCCRHDFIGFQSVGWTRPLRMHVDTQTYLINMVDIRSGMEPLPGISQQSTLLSILSRVNVREDAILKIGDFQMLLTQTGAEKLKYKHVERVAQLENVDIFSIEVRNRRDDRKKGYALYRHSDEAGQWKECSIITTSEPYQVEINGKRYMAPSYELKAAGFMPFQQQLYV